MMRGRDELPSRHSGGARDHQLQPPRQIQVAEHRADQHGERHHALGDEGHAKERDLGDEEGRDVLDVRGAPHQLEKIDHRDQHERAREHGKHRGEEAPSEISRERPGDHGACPIRALVRWAMRSMTAVIELVMKAGRLDDDSARDGEISEHEGVSRAR